MNTLWMKVHVTFQKWKQNNFFIFKTIKFILSRLFFFIILILITNTFCPFFYKYLMDSILYVCFILYFFFFILLDVCIIISNIISMLCEGHDMSSVALYVVDHIIDHNWIKVRRRSSIKLTPSVIKVVNSLY